MVLLTIYMDVCGETAGRLERETRAFFENSVEEAVRAGQASGCFYEILDMATGRAIDWNEVNYREEEEWFYDEEELIWKKHRERAASRMKLLLLPVREQEHGQTGLPIPVLYHHQEA